MNDATQIDANPNGATASSAGRNSNGASSARQNVEASGGAGGTHKHGIAPSDAGPDEVVLSGAGQDGGSESGGASGAGQDGGSESGGAIGRRDAPEAEVSAPAYWKIHGGLAMPDDSTVNTRTSVMPVSPYLALALEQPKLGSFHPLISPGDSVSKHQIIARSPPPHSSCLHAPSSGVYTGLSSRALVHPSGLKVPHMVIETDGRDYSELREADAPSEDVTGLEDLCRVLSEYGVVGHGGGNYLSSRKLLGCSVSGNLTLIINACECDPCIKCDHALMLERAREIVDAIELLKVSGGFKQTIFCIEEDMPDALAALVEAGLKHTARVKVLPSVYPMGSEKQLIYAVSGQRIGLRDHPSDVGIVCLNVGTVASAARALLRNQPVIERLITVAGGAIGRPHNVWVRIGTSIADIAEYCGGLDGREHRRTLVGGKMMGFAIDDHHRHVMRNTNALLFTRYNDDPPPPPESACIQCNYCQTVCPAELQPQQMFARIAAGRNNSADVDYHLFQCIECGCCDQVCPSHIPLTSYFRYAKGVMRRQTVIDRRKSAHDLNNAQRLERLTRKRNLHSQALEESHAAIDAEPATKKLIIERALAGNRPASHD